jgi:glycosyltransferase involved in cell wall biosynthesis
MRIHLLALPNAQTTKAYSLDGFAQATIRFARMMKDLGHTIFLYASEENEAPCDELIGIITKEEQQTLLGDTQYQHVDIIETNPLWLLSNPRIIREIAKRKHSKDIICLIGGASQQSVAKAHSDLICVEYSVGYAGSFSDFCVFESTAWRHCSYGFRKIEDGRWTDAVIPLFFDPKEFTFRDKKEPFALYVGRIITRKGVTTATAACDIADIPLKVIGHGGDMNLINRGAKYLGALDMWERNEWMSRASVVLCPTVYIEPFNAVAVEAQMCGTPVVSTDFGGFVDTIEHGKTGFRCNYLGEFAQAIKDAQKLDHAYIRQRAIEKYSMDSIKHQYQKYFDRIMLKYEKGFETVAYPPPMN